MTNHKLARTAYVLRSPMSWPLGARRLFVVSAPVSLPLWVSAIIIVAAMRTARTAVKPFVHFCTKPARRRQYGPYSSGTGR